MRFRMLKKKKKQNMLLLVYEFKKTSATKYILTPSLSKKKKVNVVELITLEP